ncbi:MAG: HEAT repeat domain-containing protein [bacterium]|nr:HEAT repeat domain-containing protein [bacterium]
MSETCSSPWRWPRGGFALLVCGLAFACAGGPAPQPEEPVAPANETVRADCEALLKAPPGEWAAKLGPAHRHGDAATPVLLELLDRDPAAPGARAVVALVGKLGDPQAAPALIDLLEDRGDLAIEAALALGWLDHSTSREALVATVRDRFADATIRTAAACSAVRLGERAVAADLIAAVLVAGTPAGQESSRQLGLPVKTRWAYERYLILRVLRDVAPELEGFDTDAPWSDLEAASQRVAAWLRL